MKKYYIIYTVSALVLVLCVLTVLFNPEAMSIFKHRSALDPVPAQNLRSSTTGDVFLIILGVVGVLGVIAAYIYHIYQFIQKIRKKGKSDEVEEEVSRCTSDEIVSDIIARRQGYPDREENKTD